ncbi:MULTISPECIES: hypothetical protein [Shewanella]|uniref:Uncharacterized protein n=1 Tax=Shewanella marisflavi TaxID=260364 RepID=A0ABX5WIC4_9GAMM|nr:MULTISPECIES: hypothetical protein [Shewanella]QDF74258.1 hypothetical protein FGA12_03240 [Shewanella marisflavi]
MLHLVIEPDTSIEDRESAMIVSIQSPQLGFEVNLSLYASNPAYRQRIDYIRKLMRQTVSDAPGCCMTRRERQALSQLS